MDSFKKLIHQLFSSSEFVPYALSIFPTRDTHTEGDTHQLQGKYFCKRKNE